MKLTQEDKKLIETAREIISKRKTQRLPSRHTKMTTVGCALVTKKGNIYTGVNIETRSAPCSICAEYAAISSMYSSGEKNIKTIVSVHGEGNIIHPCGQCREFMFEVSDKNKEIEIIINNKEKIKLKDLLPEPWQS